MTWCKDQATYPKDSIDNGQEFQPNVKIDASAELVGEHGGHARDPHDDGGLLAQPQQQHRLAGGGRDLRCPNTAGSGPVVGSTNGRTGGPSLALTLPPFASCQTWQAIEICTHVHNVHMLLNWVRPVHCKENAQMCLKLNAMVGCGVLP